MRYKAGTISIDNSWYHLGNSKLIIGFSLFSTDGNFEVELRPKGTSEFGDIIPGFINVPMSENAECVDIRVRNSGSGSIDLNYFIKTQ
jgi:hypothetical protein